MGGSLFRTAAGVMLAAMLAMGVMASPAEARGRLRVGVVVSETSHQRAAAARAPGYLERRSGGVLRGFRAARRRAHMRVFVVRDHQLRSARSLARFDVVVLPQQQYMDVQMRRSLVRYARRGGGVVAAYQTGRNLANGLPVVGQRNAATGRKYNKYNEWAQLTRLFRATFVNDIVISGGYKVDLARDGKLAPYARRFWGGGVPPLRGIAYPDWQEVIKPKPGQRSMRPATVFVDPQGVRDCSRGGSCRTGRAARLHSGTAASWTMRSGRGRVVYIGHHITQHFLDYYGAGRITNRQRARGRRVALTYLIAAAQWAGGMRRPGR
jgi:hypothetical protein